MARWIRSSPRSSRDARCGCSPIGSCHRRIWTMLSRRRAFSSMTEPCPACITASIPVAAPGWNLRAKWPGNSSSRKGPSPAGWRRRCCCWPVARGAAAVVAYSACETEHRKWFPGRPRLAGGGLALFCLGGKGRVGIRAVKIAADAEVLGDLLGREHDFDFLMARLENESGDEALRDELAQLQKLIRKRGKRLRTNALELGRRFYAEPSKGFAKRISIFVGKRRV